MDAGQRKRLLISLGDGDSATAMAAHHVNRRNKAPGAYPARGAIKLPRLPMLLLGLFALALAAGGGSSMDEVAGHAIVRAAAALCLVLALLFGPRPRLRLFVVPTVLLLAVTLLMLLQLVPLPPSIWLQLPGRAVFVEAAAIAGQPQPWRPLAIVPGAAINALAGLIVPLTALVLLASLDERERDALPTGILVFIVVAALVGVLQVTSPFDNPLINDAPEEIGGVFANHNHFALLLAIGCLLAPIWAVLRSRRSGSSWRGPVALGVTTLFILLILISGSRAGLALGALGLLMGAVIVLGHVRASLRGPRWLLPAALGGALAVAIGLIAVSVTLGRALSLDRALAIDPVEDLRFRAAPTVIAMVKLYFPFGTGAGGFDPLYRLHEPLGLLGFAYFNRAHNDFLEVLLEYGLPGLILLAGVGVWWVWATIGAWRRPPNPPVLLARAASALLLLVALASIVDYPARTPIMTALLVVAFAWLGRRTRRREPYRGGLSDSAEVA